MSSATTILFFGGYLFLLLAIFNYITFDYTIFNSLIQGLIYGGSFALKLCCFMYIFIWIRASFLRFTFDFLIKLCWTIFLLILFGLFLFVLSILLLFNALT